MWKKTAFIMVIVSLLCCIFLEGRYLLKPDEKRDKTKNGYEEIEQEEARQEKTKQKETKQKETGQEETAKENAEERAPEEPPVQKTDIRVCIDPGHYDGVNVVDIGDGTYYCEGAVTLEIAQKLQKILEEKYGITSVLTRNSGTVSIGGYRNAGLDGGHISLRGEMAEGCDLFVSIHTNANLDNANGSPTYSQPVSVTKPVIIANETVRSNPDMLRIGNCIGKNLADVNYRQGVSSVSGFQEVREAADLQEWTDAYNDSPDVQGTISVRRGSHGDYYGVLRGAANKNVPGFIIEHAHHTVYEVRRQVLEGDLTTLWAEADAKGIAEGFGIIKTDEE